MNPIDLIVALIVLVGLLVNVQPLIPIGAIGVVALRGASTRLLKWMGFKKVEWAIVICLGYWLASYFWSQQSLGNLISYDFLRNDGAMLISYSAFIFFLGWPLKANQCRAFWIIFLLVLSFVALAGVAITLNLPYSWVFEPLGVVGEEQGGGYTFFGWYRAHNTAGGVYAIAVVLALALLQEPKLAWKPKVFRWMLLMCCLIGLFITYSRGAYLASVAGAAVVLPIRKLGQTMKAVLLVGVPAVLIAVMSSSVLDRIDTITDPYYGTNADRMRIWGEALRDFYDSPLVGMGYGRFNDTDLHYWGVKNLVWVATKGKVVNDDSHAHNSYLHFLAEGGLVGLFVTMLVWWCAWKELSFFESHFPRSQLHWLEKAASGCLIVAMGQALTEHMIGRGSVVLLLDALIGITLASARVEAKTARAASKFTVAAKRSDTPAAHVRPERLAVR